jgi:hypothetical protein
MPSRDGLSPPTAVLTQSRTRRPSQTQRIASHTANRVLMPMIVTAPLVHPSKLPLHIHVLPVQFIGAASMHPRPLPCHILAWLLWKRSSPTLRTIVGLWALQMTTATATTWKKNHPPMRASPFLRASQIGSKSSEILMINMMWMSACKSHMKYQEPCPTPKKRTRRTPLVAR